jgi:hypothetical protein
MQNQFKLQIHFALIAVVLLALLAGCSKAPVSMGFDWPRWRGPNGDGISKETDWNPRALAGSPKRARENNWHN